MTYKIIEHQIFFHDFPLADIIDIMIFFNLYLI